MKYEQNIELFYTNGAFDKNA